MGTEADTDTDEQMTGQARRRVRRWVVLVAAGLLAGGLALVWGSRVSIADNLISDELARQGIHATYEIESIGGRYQILRNVVVGDPKQPDLTIERAEVVIEYGLGLPKVGSLRIVRPRLFGTYLDGKLSFGELDPLLFAKKETSAELPDLDLALVDGRGLIEGDFGPVALKIEGQGNLQGGFRGEVGAVAPRLALSGCKPVRATLYGELTVQDRRPGFEGPVRFGPVDCTAPQLIADGGDFQLKARTDAGMANFEGDIGLVIKPASVRGARLDGLKGSARFSWRDGGLTSRYDIKALGLTTEQVEAASLSFDGSLRARRGFDRVELETEVDGDGVKLGDQIDAVLADAAEASSSTLLGPLMAQVRSRLAAESRDSRLVADLTVRKTDDRLSVVAPNVYLRGRSGGTLLSVSHVELSSNDGGIPLISGSFSTGGEGLPKIAGRMEQGAAGSLRLNLMMAEYAAGSSRLEIPGLSVSRAGDGSVEFAGNVRASGALPGGGADNLVLPVEGAWTSATGLSMWRKCTELRFDGMRLANLTADRQRLTLCPARGSAILSVDQQGVHVAAGAPSLQLAGQLGETPIAIRSGAVGIAYPGSLSVKEMLVTLGPTDTASTFAVSDLSADVGDRIAGRFSGADIKLGAVPLDLNGAEGIWRYADEGLVIDGADFTLTDRNVPARFEPLTAQGATLALRDNRITAAAVLRHPASGREVTRAEIAHDLSSGRGRTDLTVTGLTFDESLQPLDLTRNAEGVIALARGTVTGTGRIDWNEQGVESSGRFTSDSLDFAAAFGPVKGVSGTVVFTDLLGLTTAPGQKVRVASINPGIEVNDGELVFSLTDGEVLALESGAWPFMGGRLTMRPVQIRFGASEIRNYVLDIEGLDAARFVEHMELNNLAATGTFDGTVPLIFDAVGDGRVENGLLTSREPGGNVSYVGELTYQDLGAMANFAFNALRSLDYRKMQIQMEGSLTGEIITRVRLDGVSQGEDASKNLITNAIAGLPIRVDVNIRAPFYQLIGTTRAIYDPAAIRDPRTLGLLDDEGNVIRTESDGTLPEPPPDHTTNDTAVIQRRESEEMP